MPGAADADQQLELVTYLKSMGFTDAEIAANDARSANLVSGRVLFGAEGRITVAEVAARAGCDEALVRKVRLAAGLPDGGDDPVCSPREADVMAGFAAGVAVFGEAVTLQFVRVVGNAMSAVAEAALATFSTNRQVALVDGGASLVEIARAGADATTALLSVPPVMDVLLRLHFAGASVARFAGTDPGPMVSLAVGFVDLVASTQLTLALSGTELAAALTDFEQCASDAVVAAGGRIVKRIGDAVMFVTSDPSGACAAAAAMLESVARHPQLHTARAAVTWGALLPRDGDYFGRAVNLASRAVALAEPGALVVDEAARDMLPASSVVALGAQSLKGFDDPVPLFLFRG